MRMSKYIAMLWLIMASNVAIAGKGWYVRITNDTEVFVTMNQAGSSCWYWKDINRQMIIPPMQSIQLYTEASDAFPSCINAKSIAGIDFTWSEDPLKSKKTVHFEIKGASGDFGSKISKKIKCGDQGIGSEQLGNGLDATCEAGTQNIVNVLFSDYWQTSRTGKGSPFLWVKKQLDASRGMLELRMAKCLLNDITNAWQCEDQSLTMNPLIVRPIEVMTNVLLKDGRYIYVYRATDDKFVMRNYDRGDPTHPTCDAYYKKYQLPENKGQHVRHTQINAVLDAQGTYNGWGPVWSAGELRVKNGKVAYINNASGHFKPSRSHVMQAVNFLESVGQSAPDIRNFAGGFEDVSTELTDEECSRLN